jgi:hypothetical protein
VEAREKGCDIEFKKTLLYINTDSRYAEIVVYNLLTNAVKYAYNNTSIYIHFKKSNIQNSYLLTVTNFTFNILGSSRFKIFNMGFRTSKARGYFPEGSGIGLWLVRKIMEILNGSVKLCEPEKISNFNVPLLYACIKNPDLYVGTEEEFYDVKEEYNRLLNDYIINDLGEKQNKISWIISNYNWSDDEISESDIKYELYKATYKIQFEVKFYV